MAVKPIIIPLVADVSGLEPAVDTLEALGKVDKAAADQFRAANKAFQERGKVLDETVTSTERFAASTKKAGESIVGGAFKQAAENAKKLADQIKNIPQVLIPGGALAQVANLKGQFTAGGLAVDALSTSINLAKQRLQELDQGSKAFEDLENEIKASVVTNELLNKSFTSTRGELRAMREALTQLEDAGLENTKIFQTLATEAGALDDQIGDTQARIKTLGSDTFKFDAAIQAVRGVTGAFSIAQGAAALFGDENEDLQKTLLKVNAAMAILNGLQEIQNLLQKQTALSVATGVALQKISVLQTNLQAAAESRNIVVRYAAIAAQTLLNDVMAANPAGLLLLALGAVAGALLIFSSNSEEAADSQEDLSKQTQKVVESLNAEIDAQARLRNARAGGLSQLRQEIAELNARGGARSKVAALESKALDEEIQNARIRKETFKGVAGAEKEFDEASEEIVRLKGERRVKDLEAQKAASDEGIEIGKKALEDQKKATQDFLKDQVAANEAALIESRDGFERLVAQIALINAKLRLELANSDLGPNERLAAELSAGEQIRKARQDLLGDLQSINATQSDLTKESINNEVLLSAQGAQQRLQVEQQAAQERIRITEQEEETKKQVRQQAIDAIIQLASSLGQSMSEIARNNTDAQVQALQDQLDRGLITQQQFDQKSRAIRRKAAQEEKQLAVFQATINAAAAIVKVFMTTGPPLSFILAATTAAATLAQISAIQSKPLPAFRKGTKDAPGGASLVGEAGPELIYSKGNWQYASRATVLDLPKHAKVIPTLETKQILSKYDIPMPNVQQHVNTSVGGIRIDYGKLGQAVGKELSKLPLQVNKWDEKGFSSYQTSVSNRNTFINGKYSSPRK